jgi:tetratricopeptide (TPR) repeat protein
VPGALIIVKRGQALLGVNEAVLKPSKILPPLLFLSILFFPHLATSRYIVRPLDQAVFHNNQGVTFLNAGDAEKGLHEFKLAVELSPEFTEGWNNLGLAYLYLNQYDQAKDAFLRSIKIDSKYPTPYNHLATLYYNQGNYQESIKWSKEAISKDKKFADAYYNMGIAYRELAKQTKDPKDAQQGEQAFRNATEASSRHYLANFELGNLYQEQGKIEEAIMRYKIALEIQPSAAQVWKALGNLYLKQGDNQKAQWAFEKAMAAGGGGPQATPSSHLDMGLLYLRQKNYPLAEKELALAKQQDPENPRVLFNVAFLKLGQAEEIRAQQGPAAAQGSYQEALTEFQGLVQKQPNYTDAAYNIGYIYTRLNQLPEALQWYEKTLQIDPNYSKALFVLGMMKIQSGQKEEGVKYLCRFSQTASADQASAKQAAEQLISQNGKCK